MKASAGVPHPAFFGVRVLTFSATAGAPVSLFEPGSFFSSSGGDGFSRRVDDYIRAALAAESRSSTEGGVTLDFRALRPNIPLPPANRFRPYQTRRPALRPAHLQRIPICQITRNVARICQGNVRPFSSQLHVIALVSEPVRQQPRPAIFPARHHRIQHENLPCGGRILKRAPEAGTALCVFQGAGFGLNKIQGAHSTNPLQHRAVVHLWKMCVA